MLKLSISFVITLYIAIMEHESLETDLCIAICTEPLGGD
jgi:hypothetical protein